MTKRWFLATSLLLIGCGGPNFPVTNLKIKGSDSEVNLVLTIAEAFMARDSAVSIAVSGGGSGLGIAALINGKTDIANSSRALAVDELALARAQGIQPQAIVFCTDALALVVHPSNPVNALNLEQLRGIFNGKITNWQQVGGADRPISKYGRQSNSGTYVYFREEIVKADFAPDVIAMNGTAQIVEAIKTDESALGYVSVGYIQTAAGSAGGVKVLGLKTAAAQPLSYPTDAAAVATGTYPLVRPLYQYIDGKPRGKLADFIRFELSAAGQRLIAAEGFSPIPARHQANNAKILAP